MLWTEKGAGNLKRQAAYVRTLRERSGAVFAKFFTVVHAIEWIAWYGDNDPDVINEQSIKSYENEVHTAFGPLLGAIAMVASLNLEDYLKVLSLLAVPA